MHVLRNKHHEYDPVWHVQLGLASVIIIQILLPNSLSAFPNLLVPLLVVICMIGLNILTPKTATFTSHLRRAVVLLVITAIAVANIASLQLLFQAMFHANSAQAPQLLLSAAGIYYTNIVIFGLLYWEIDDGGPGQRRLKSNDGRDFLFPQQNLGYTLSTLWFPTFLDYLYVSITNATAFSPTDTLPLSRRAKFIMGIQALISLIIVVLITARAINIL